MTTALSADTIAAMQSLSGPFSVGDVAIAAGYHVPADGGGGAFAFDDLAITATELQTRSITAASNPGEIVITTSASHPYEDGQAVVISGVLGNTAANGTWIIDKLTTTTFKLVGSEGNSAYTSGGSVNSVKITASANHNLVSGQRVVITRNSAPSLNTTWDGIGKISAIVFSLATSVSPGTGGTFGDAGRSFPSSTVDARWLRIDPTLTPRFYGARCDNATDDSRDVQAMIDANPGGRYLLPGSTTAPVTIFMGSTSLFMKGPGWVLEGGGQQSSGSGLGGTTMRWESGATGIIALNRLGTGEIRNLNLKGGDNFLGAENGVWSDAVLPNFTDQSGTNIFTRGIKSISRSSNVVTVTVEATNEYGHTYVPGTQVTIGGVTGDTDMNGLHYISDIGQTSPSTGVFDTFQYANSGPDVSFPTSTGTSSISNTGTSTADAIVAGAAFLRLENLNIQSWGRFGINAVGSGDDYWADNQSFRNITISNCRGIGMYVRGGDANASDFQQIFLNVVLVGGIYDTGFLGNSHVAPGVNYCGGDWNSQNGAPQNIDSIDCVDNVVTIETPSTHGFKVGQAVVLSSLSDSSFEAPAGSGVFVASVPTSTSFTYNFTHTDGSATAGGTARLATATELFTLAGTGQHTDGSKGTGFSYWISGFNNSRVVINPYSENANGPSKFGAATLVIGGTQGAPPAAGFRWPFIGPRGSSSSSNISQFDGNVYGATPDLGTTLYLRGGHLSEQPNQITLQGHKTTITRWHIRDDIMAANPSFRIGRQAWPGKGRLQIFAGQETYAIASAVRAGGVVTVTTTAPHAIGYSSAVVISGVTPSSFDGTFQALGSLTDTTFQYSQAGSPETATPATGTVVNRALNYPGEMHLSGEDTGGIVLNRFGGTGGLRLYDGAASPQEVLAFDSAGKVSRYKSITTVANGVPAQYAQVNVVNRTSAIASTNAYAVPATGAGVYRISYYAKVTRAATTSGSVGLTLGWTDVDDNACLTTTAVTLLNATDITGVQLGSIIVDAKESTNITYATAYASSGATSLEYKLRLRVEAL